MTGQTASLIGPTAEPYVAPQNRLIHIPQLRRRPTRYAKDRTTALLRTYGPAVEPSHQRRSPIAPFAPLAPYCDGAFNRGKPALAASVLMPLTRHTCSRLPVRNVPAFAT